MTNTTATVRYAETGVQKASLIVGIVFLLFGVAGVAFATSFAGSRNYLIWGGVVYAVLFLYGLFVTGDNPANFVPMNVADNWLHVALAVGMVALGLLLGRRRDAGPVRSAA